MIIILTKKYVVAIGVVLLALATLCGGFAYYRTSYVEVHDAGEESIAAIGTESLLPQVVKNDLYEISLPKGWTVEKNEYNLQFKIKDIKVGCLNVFAFYPWDERLEYIMGNHKEILEERRMEGFDSDVRLVRLARSKPVAANDNTITEEIHICFVDKENYDVYDLMFLSEYVKEETATYIAKTFLHTFDERLSNLVKDARPINIGEGWISKVSPGMNEKNIAPTQEINITFSQSMDPISLNPINVVVSDYDYGYKISKFLRYEYNQDTKTLNIRFLEENESFGTSNSIIVYITSKVRNIKGKEMGQTYYLRFQTGV